MSLSETVIVQGTQEAEAARAIVNAVLKHGRQGSAHMIYQGIYAAKGQENDIHDTLGYDSFKSLCAGEFGVTYRTMRRRIRAGEWHTKLGAPLEDVASLEYTKLDEFRDVADEDNWREVLDDLAALSDADMLVKWKGKAEKKEKVVACPKCGYVGDMDKVDTTTGEVTGEEESGDEG